MRRHDPRPARGLCAIVVMSSMLGFSSGCAPREERRVEPWIPAAAVSKRPDSQPIPLDSLETGVHDAPLPIDLATVLRFLGERREAIEVLVARERAAAAEADVTSAALSFVPTVTPTLAWSRTEGRRQNTPGLIFDVERQSVYGGVGVDLSVNPAESLLETIAAHRRAGALRADLDTASQEAIRVAARRYYELVSRSARERIQAEALRHAEELSRIEAARVEAGTGIEVDLLRARARLAETRGALAAASGEVGVASARLVELLQLDPGVRLTPASEALFTVDLFGSDVSLEELIARARRERPELESAARAEGALAADASREGLAWMFPRVRGGVRLGELGSTFGSSDRGDQEIYYAALELELDFARITRWKSASHRRQAARHTRVGLEQRIVAEVVEAHERVRSGRLRVAAAREQVESARTALATAESRRQAGAGLLLDVLDAQEALVRALSAATAAIVELNQAQYDLARAVGGA